MAKQCGQTRKQEQAITALLTADTMQDAAKVCGISSRTLQRWLNTPEFAEAYRKAKSNLLAKATTKLRRSMGVAVDVLEAIAKDKKSPAAARVTAASRIIELGLKAHETESFDERLSKFEYGDGEEI